MVQFGTKKSEKDTLNAYKLQKLHLKKIPMRKIISFCSLSFTEKIAEQASNNVNNKTAG